MTCSGMRHPFYCKWKAGFMKDGRVTALKLDMYSNAGFSLDLSCSVMERALFSADNAYNIPNVEFNGTCCKTNLPSNTGLHSYTFLGLFQTSGIVGPKGPMWSLFSQPVTN